VLAAAGNGRDAAEPGYLHGCADAVGGARGERAVPQLAEVVVAPGPDGAIALHRQAVLAAAGNGRDAAEPGYLHGCADAVGGARGERAVPQLAEVVVAPGPDGAVALQRQAVI